MEGARLAAHDIACRRGDRLLFAGLSFELGAGDALQVTGANGTGKSSLIRILAGLLRPFSGSLERGGDIALLDGNLPLDAHLPLGKALGFWEKIDRPRVSAVDDGLAALADVPVRFLSTGQRKRAAVLQSNPAANAIWLLDEPASGLDPRSFDRFVTLLRDYAKRGITICIIEHNLDIVIKLSDRVAFLDQGKLLAQGSSEDILKDPHLAAIYFGERA